MVLARYYWPVRKALKEHNLTPIGRFVSYQVAGVSPKLMGIGPCEAIPKALKQAGLGLEQMDWIELNEAFAAQSLAVIKDLALDTTKVNPLGGAIALRSSVRCHRRHPHRDLNPRLTPPKTKIRHSHHVYRHRHGRRRNLRSFIIPKGPSIHLPPLLSLLLR